MADSSNDEVVETVTVSASRSLQMARQPRGIVQLNGVRVDGWISWTVTSNSFFEADTFRVSYAASILPPANDADWFSQQKEIFVEIFAGFPTDPAKPDPGELASLIYGRVDSIEFDPHDGGITLSGRDLTAVFIDSKIASEYKNQPSSGIVATLAAGHAGIETSIVATKSKAGTYFDQDQYQLRANHSEWDLIAYLARKEAFVAYVQSHTLFFQPDQTSTNNPFNIIWQRPSATNASPTANVEELHFFRDLTVGKGIAVTARSANLKTGVPVVQSYPSAARPITPGKASPFGQVQNFYVSLAAGKTPFDVEAEAKARYDEIVGQEMKMTCRLPADSMLGVQTPIKVSGTRTKFDQVYYPRAITRVMSIDEGYEMTVDASNVNADSTPES